MTPTARQRYFALIAEHERATDLIREAQEADAQAVREAVAEGKQPPKLKAPAAVEKAAQGGAPA